MVSKTLSIVHFLVSVGLLKSICVEIDANCTTIHLHVNTDPDFLSDQSECVPSSKGPMEKEKSFLTITRWHDFKWYATMLYSCTSPLESLELTSHKLYIGCIPVEYPGELPSHSTSTPGNLWFSFYYNDKTVQVMLLRKSKRLLTVKHSGAGLQSEG